MTFYAALISLLVGSVAGIVYGLSFGLFRERRALSFVMTVVRLSTAGLLAFYVLRFSSIHFILLLPSFLMMFWLTVLKRKVAPHERS